MIGWKCLSNKETISVSLWSGKLRFFILCYFQQHETHEVTLNLLLQFRRMNEHAYSHQSEKIHLDFFHLPMFTSYQKPKGSSTFLLKKLLIYKSYNLTDQQFLKNREIIGVHSGGLKRFYTYILDHF